MAWEKLNFVKEKILNDLWWDKNEYIVSFTKLIYEMLKIIVADKPSVYLVQNMWDTMIERMKGVIYRHEGKEMMEILLFMIWCTKFWWIIGTKATPSLYCLTRSLNPR